MSADAYAARIRRIVRYDGVAIDVIVDGQGPAIVLLPSLARDSEDYDAVADGLAALAFACCGRSRAGSAPARAR